MEPNINKMAVSEKYDRIGSTRCFGVEIETDRCDNYLSVNQDYWGTHYDMTCMAEEFVSAILNGNDGLAAIEDLLGFANKNDWRVGQTCGLHVHINVSSETVDSLKAIALAYQTSYFVWAQFIKSSRLDDTYCSAKEDSCAALSSVKSRNDWDHYAFSNTRYSWLNWQAFEKHGTCEVRCHEGTLDPSKVVNWVRAHTVFVSWAARTGFVGVRAALWGRTHSEKCTKLAEIWEDAGCGDLVAYYKEMTCAV